MEIYADVSHKIHEIFQRYTPLIEPLSLDEAFLDVSGSEGLFGTTEKIGRRIKDEILQDLDLVASVGVAPNKFLAKIASDLEKPDGFVVVDPERTQQFLDPLPISRLWGVGRVMQDAFERLGVHTIFDVRSMAVETLQRHFGDHGSHLWELSRGIDQRRVIPDREAKSISHETTFAEDISEMEVLRAWIVELTDQVARRLRRSDLYGRTVQLKVRFSDFKTITRSTTLPRATNSTQQIWQATNEMLSNRLPAGHLAVRLLGVGVTGFQSSKLNQLSLFSDDSHEAQSSLDVASDEIRERFGSKSIGRASGLGRRRRP
jgi:DNA polymerase-4